MTDVIKRRIIIKRASSLLLLFLLCACDGTLFHTFCPMGGEWRRDSVAEFAYIAYYSPYASRGMRVEARTDASYRYQNLVVRAEILNVNDSLLLCDTLPIMVYGNDGRRIGATAGMLYHHESNIVVPDIFFGDSVIIRLCHIMPDDTLKGVHDVGLKLMRLN